MIRYNKLQKKDMMRLKVPNDCKSKEKRVYFSLSLLGLMKD